MSGFHSAQQEGENDFQSCQQQLLYKQLQVFQAHQQFQQLDDGFRPRNAFNQFHPSIRPASLNHMPAILNEVPGNDNASNYGWSNNTMSSDTRVVHNSQMTKSQQYIDGMSCEPFRGVPANSYSNIHAQSMKTHGVVSNVDPSFYSTLAANSKGFGNHNSHCARTSNDFKNMMRDQLEKASVQLNPFNPYQNEQTNAHQDTGRGYISSSNQNSQGDGIQSNATIQRHNMNVQPDNFFPSNNLQFNGQMQRFCGAQHQGDWTGNSQDKLSQQFESTGGASLDPTEQKLLFGSDEGTNWAALIGRDSNPPLGGFVYSSSTQNDNFNVFPSLHSGSWSALMQEALEASSSENGLQEEWSGLQRAEQSVATASAFSNESGKRMATNEDNVQAVSSLVSKPVPLRRGIDSNTSLSFGNNFPPIKTPFGHMVHNSSESLGLPPTNTQESSEVNDKYFHQTVSQNDSDVDCLREQMQFSNGMWALRTSNLQDGNLPSGMQFMPQVAPFCTPQGMLLQSFGNQPSDKGEADLNACTTMGENPKSNSWNICRSELLSPKASLGELLPSIDSDMKEVNWDQNGVLVVRNQNNYNDFNASSHWKGAQDRTDHNQWMGATQASCMNNNRRPEESRQDGGYMISRSYHGQDSINVAGGKSSFVGNESQPQSHSEQFVSQSGEVIGSYMRQNHQLSTLETNSFSSAPIPALPSQLHPHSGFIESSVQSPYCHTTQQSGNMLELLHKVDLSRSVENSVNTGAGMSNQISRDASATYQQINMPLQGFGLQLAPPSQVQQHSSGPLFCQSSFDKAGKRDQMQITSPSSCHSLHSSSSQPSPYNLSDVDHTGQMSAPLSHNSGLSSQPLVSVLDKKPCLQPSMASHGGPTSMFKNLLTNISFQGLGGPNPNKIPPNILQSMIYSNNTGNANLWASQKEEYQEKKGDGVDPEIGANCLQSQQRQTLGYTNQPSSKMKIGSPPVHQQEVSNERQYQNLLNKALNTSSASPAGLNSVQHPVAFSDVQQQSNYSMLNQMRAVAGADIHAKVEKKMKGTELGIEASPTNWQVDQGFNASINISSDRKASMAAESMRPADAQMFRFTTKDGEDQSACMPNLPERVLSSHDSDNARKCVTHPHASPITSSSSISLIERSEHLKVIPQRTPSRNEQYGIQKSGQNSAVHNNHRFSSQHFSFPAASLSTDKIFTEQTHSNSQTDAIHGKDSVSLQRHTPDIEAYSAVLRQKKRKLATCELLSWQRTIEGQQRVQNIRMAEVDWAHTTNMLLEKSEDEMLEDDKLPARIRLSLSTRFTQQIFPALPSSVIKAKAALAFEPATYYVSRLALGEACSMTISWTHSSSDSCNSDKLIERCKNHDKTGNSCGELVESFIEKMTKSENDFTRLNKRSPLIDLQLECQELERFSIVNRLGKFHGPIQAYGPDGYDSSRRLLLQRQVTPVHMQSNIPEGLQCLLL